MDFAGSCENSSCVLRPRKHPRSSQSVGAQRPNHFPEWDAALTRGRPRRSHVAAFFMARPPNLNTPQPIFSPEDADLAALHWSKMTVGYSMRGEPRPSRKKYMAHRVVLSRMLGRPLRRGEYADHINGDRMDNRRTNLRVVNAKQSVQNRFHGKKYVGTSWDSSRNKWVAQIMVDYKKIHVGRYDDREVAYDAVKKARDKYGFVGTY